MRIVTLDIETIPVEWGEEGFPPLTNHLPVVISWIVTEIRGDVARFDLRTYRADRDDAVRGLVRLRDDLAQADIVVTFNGRGFDMPLLGLEALRLGVVWRFWGRMRHRFPNYKNPLVHYDMQDQLGDYNARNISLDGAVTLTLGLPGKYGISGADVAERWKTSPDDVVTYCGEDVLQTLLLFLRWAQVTGNVPHRVDWGEVINGALDFAHRTPEFSSWCEVLDDDVFPPLQ